MPSLEWIGKDKVLHHHMDVPYQVMDLKYGFDSDNPSDHSEKDTQNMIIHADSLNALKALLPKYEGRVDVIYIDPPYNTGNENWIYNDNVNDPRIKKWIGEVVGSEGNDLTRHDKWLCMMYPRLRLLQQLLSPTGVIFASINFVFESAHLRMLMDEIFGTRNFIGELTWESTTQPTNSGKARFGLQNKTEPILFYCKDRSQLPLFRLSILGTKSKYPHIGKLGQCRFEIIEKSDAGAYQRDTMKYPILGQYPREGKRWQIGYDTAKDLLDRDRIEIVDGIVKKAVYPEDEGGKISYVPFWSHLTAKEVGTAQKGKDLLNEILGRDAGFDTVKPVGLIQSLLSHFGNDVTVLDCFAGSGTTAHAVLSMNKDDEGSRHFILVEMMDYVESITASRVKNVMTGYNDVTGLGGSFNFYELGVPLFSEDGFLNEDVPVQTIREYIYYSETRRPLRNTPESDNDYLLDTFNDVGYYLFYEKDKLTTLSINTLNYISTKAGHYVVYADLCTIPDSFLVANNIVFKKIPRDIKRF